MNVANNAAHQQRVDNSNRYAGLRVCPAASGFKPWHKKDAGESKRKTGGAAADEAHKSPITSREPPLSIRYMLRIEVIENREDDLF
jgi:hypothetical protein